MPFQPNNFLFLCSLCALTACSSGGDDDVAQPVNDEPTTINQTPGPIAPTGAVTSYGSVTVADEEGLVSDLIASFYTLDSGVSAAFMNEQFSTQSGNCQVQDDGVIDFEEISTVFVPDVPGIPKNSVDAGDSVILTSQDGGTFATLDRQPTAGLIFYDLSDTSMLANQVVPDDLTVDVTGGAEFPVISSTSVPVVDPLGQVDYGDVNSITVNSQFSWTPASETGSLLRIFTTTNGGFFLEDGVTVTCLVPDTGSFSFPADIQAQLGEDFSGTTPIISRLAVSAVQLESTVFYVIRESFSSQ